MRILVFNRFLSLTHCAWTNKMFKEARSAKESLSQRQQLWNRGSKSYMKFSHSCGNSTGASLSEIHELHPYK
jgi:hypothetical protein